MGNDICDLLCGIFYDRDSIILEKEVSKFQFATSGNEHPVRHRMLVCLLLDQLSLKNTLAIERFFN